MQAQESAFDRPVAGEKQAFEIFSVVEKFGLEGLAPGQYDDNLAAVQAERTNAGVPIEGDWETGM